MMLGTGEVNRMDDDTISRQAAIDALFELYEYQRDIDPTEAADLVRQGIYLAEKKIEQLPSAERRGRWIDGNEGKWNTVYCPKCSVCHTPFYGIETARYHYCPNCGARMED